MNSSKDPEYQSGEILLDLCKSEYESEKSRTSIIDSKTNIVISLTAVFFIAITQVINFKKILSVNIDSFANVLIPTILFISIIASLVTGFVALIYFLRVIFTKEYKSVDVNYFYNKDKLKVDKQLFSIATAQFYIEAINVNVSANDHRIKLYRKGMIFLIVSIVTFAIHVCFISFI